MKHLALVLSTALLAVLSGPTLHAQRKPASTPAAPAANASTEVWTGSWAAAPVAAPAAPPSPAGTTYRDIVHLSLGGSALRVRLTNDFGPTPLVVASTHVALSAPEGATQPETDHAVTFGGVAAVTIPAGTSVVSDPIPFAVPPFANLAVSLFVPPQPDATLTYHAYAASTNYAAAGDQAAAPTLSSPRTITSWYLLKGVDVDAGPSASSVVILGASISEGYHSTPDKNARWTDVLAGRLQANPATAGIGVLNQGISGNRLLHDGTGPAAVARLDRDVLAQPGARYLIIALGTNDIGRTFFPLQPNQSVTADNIVWILQQIAARAHARGFRVIASTLNPFGGAAYYNSAGEQMRRTVNAFMLTSPAFDGIIDFDQPLRDPAHPENLLPAYDSGDHLHPNDAGYKAMGESINLKLFERK
jgi:lysophospholipase L1-like esterase